MVAGRAVARAPPPLAHCRPHGVGSPAIVDEFRELEKAVQKLQLSEASPSLIPSDCTKCRKTLGRGQMGPAGTDQAGGRLPWAPSCSYVLNHQHSFYLFTETHRHGEPMRVLLTHTLEPAGDGSGGWGPGLLAIREPLVKTPSSKEVTSDGKAPS